MCPVDPQEGQGLPTIQLPVVTLGEKSALELGPFFLRWRMGAGHDKYSAAWSGSGLINQMIL